MCEERYNGWANRETWAVALHVNNDQGWQESVLDALRGLVESIPANSGEPDNPLWEYRAGELIRENVESVLHPTMEWDGCEPNEAARNAARDIGSLWRVDWTELGQAFLADLADEDGAS
jgi:hypothetical protein